MARTGGADGIMTEIDHYAIRSISTDLIEKWAKGTLTAYLDASTLSTIDIFMECAERSDYPTLFKLLEDYKEARLND